MIFEVKKKKKKKEKEPLEFERFQIWYQGKRLIIRPEGHSRQKAWCGRWNRGRCEINGSRSLVYSEAAPLLLKETEMMARQIGDTIILWCAALGYSELLGISLFPSFIGLCHAYPLLKANFTHIFSYFYLMVLSYWWWAMHKVESWGTSTKRNI